MKNSGILMLPPEIWTILSKQYSVQASIAAATHCIRCQHIEDSVHGKAGVNGFPECFVLVRSRVTFRTGLMAHRLPAVTTFPQRNQKCSRLGRKRFPSVRMDTHSDGTHSLQGMCKAFYSFSVKITNISILRRSIIC